MHHLNTLPSLFALLTVLALPLAQAQEMEHHHHETTAVSTLASADAMSAGEVTKIDRDAGKITLRHGPLLNLDMPGMTMAFKVGNPAMLEQVKPGDKVHFVVERASGGLTITTLEAAN